MKLQISELQKKLNEPKATNVVKKVETPQPKKVETNKPVENKGNKEVPASSSQAKKVQIFETKKDDSKKKEDKKDEGRKGEVFKSMKVSGIAKQLEAILNRPKTMGGESQKEATPIAHTKVDLAEENPETPAISYGGGSRRKRAKKAFVDNDE